jgi:hypothetical protein
MNSTDDTTTVYIASLLCGLPKSWSSPMAKHTNAITNIMYVRYKAMRSVGMLLTRFCSDASKVALCTTVVMYVPTPAPTPMESDSCCI